MTECTKCKDTSCLIAMKRCLHVFCGKCLVEYFQEIRVKYKCMFSKCNENIADSIIRKCLTDEQISAYDKLSINKCNMKSFRCLTKDCPYIVIYEECIPTFECEYCKSPNCISCNKRHYPNDCGRKTDDEVVIEARARNELKARQRLEFENLLKTYALVPNHTSFECPICSEYILPREGVILRNCTHEICVDCLKATIGEKTFISHMKCLYSDCNVFLDTSEISVLVNEKKLASMMVNEAKSRFYQCKNEGCNGIWDASNSTGSYECPECNVSNCLDCQDIHDGSSCEIFRKTKRYITAHSELKILTENRRIKCFTCQNEMIQKGGCGAMYCDICTSHTCIFTGKMVGKHELQKCYCNGAKSCTKKDNYCNCTASKPCHKDCLYGCIPEDH